MLESPFCLETRELSYCYSGSDRILNAINVQVTAGCIYGFLGPNGAGKTTTLRLVLGLLKVQEGTISFFGSNLSEHRTDILRKVGSLIETPSLYSHLTAKENLEVLRKIYRVPKENIDKVLNLVGLSNTKNKKAGQFSLGMKQRLSIAMTLLHNPSLLILDEPTNGLDPNGIIEMRNLLKQLNQEHGITIIPSSHLLTEIEKLVTHLGIIHQGTMRFQGTLAELNALKHCAQPVVFETDNIDSTLKIINEYGLITSVEDGRISVSGICRSDIALVNTKLVSNGIQVYGITSRVNDLEKIFMDVIGE